MTPHSPTRPSRSSGASQADSRARTRRARMSPGQSTPPPGSPAFGQGSGPPPGPGDGGPLVYIDEFHNNTGNPGDGQAAARQIGRQLSSASVGQRDRSLG
jgi:hypothetical protein